MLALSRDACAVESRWAAFLKLLSSSIFSVHLSIDSQLVDFLVEELLYIVGVQYLSYLRQGKT